MRDNTLTVANEPLTLMPERAVFWSRGRTLFVADVHFGKAAAFRALSVPVPEGGLADDLARLTHAIERMDAQQVIFLGDVLHAKHGRAQHVLDRVSEWRATHSRRHFLMVRGNHDVRAGDPPEEWQFGCVDEPLNLSPFVLCHAPRESDDGYVLAGHVHPATSLRGRGGLSAKLPCFAVGARRMILPAFGHFTGTAVVRRGDAERIFVVADEDVIEISPLLHSR